MKLYTTGLTTFLAATLVQAIHWQSRAPLREGVSGGNLAFLGDKLVYAGGTTWRQGVKRWLSETLIYTIATDSWSAGAPLPEPLAYGACLRDGRTIEILGGINASGISRHCWRLSEDASRWVPSGVTRTPTVFAKAGLIRSIPYLFGGCDDASDLRGCSDSVFRRTERGEWVHAGSMPQGRLAMPALAVLDHRAYLFGGCSASAAGAVVNRTDAYSYDPDSNGWRALKPLPLPIRGLAAVTLNNHQILLLGGVTGQQASAPEFLKAVYVYDIAQDRYKASDSIPLPVMGMEAVFDGRMVWGVGGEDKARSRSHQLIQGIVSNQ